MLSYHQPIQFTLRWDFSGDRQAYRNIKRTNWSVYQIELGNLIDTTPESDDLDTMTEQLGQNIRQAFHKSCPLTKPGKRAKLDWWTNELRDLKKDYKQKRANYHFDRTEQNRILRNQADSAYTSALNKAKNQSWTRFCDNLKDTTAIAKMHKLMKDGRMNDISSLRRRVGDAHPGGS